MALPRKLKLMNFWLTVILTVAKSPKSPNLN